MVADIRTLFTSSNGPYGFGHYQLEFSGGYGTWHDSWRTTGSIYNDDFNLGAAGSNPLKTLPLYMRFRNVGAVGPLASSGIINDITYPSVIGPINININRVCDRGSGAGYPRTFSGSNGVSITESDVGVGNC